MAGKSKRPCDVSQRAKLIVDIATGEVENEQGVKTTHGQINGSAGAKKNVNGDPEFRAQKPDGSFRRDRQIFACLGFSPEAS